MKVTSFTKQNLPEIRKQINAKLVELKALGLNIELGNISFNDYSFTSKLECRLENAKDVFAEAFDQSFAKFGYKNAVGTTINFMGNTYIFRGFKPGARVKQAVVERNGKTYRVDFNLISGQLSLSGK